MSRANPGAIRQFQFPESADLPGRVKPEALLHSYRIGRGAIPLGRLLMSAGGWIDVGGRAWGAVAVRAGAAPVASRDLKSPALWIAF
jgi:hypothetical protein